MNSIREDFVKRFCIAVKSGVTELGWSKAKAVAVLKKAEITIEDVVSIGDSEIEAWYHAEEKYAV